MACGFEMFSPWSPGVCFWAPGVRSRISPQHHSWWRLLLYKNQRERTQKTRARCGSSRKRILAARLHPWSKCYMLWIPRRLLNWFGQSTHNLNLSRNTLTCMPWVVFYQSPKTIAPIKFIISIHHHNSTDWPTVKKLLVKQFLLEKWLIFHSTFHLLLTSRKIFSLYFYAFLSTITGLNIDQVSIKNNN